MHVRVTLTDCEVELEGNLVKIQDYVYFSHLRWTFSVGKIENEDG